MFHCYINYKKKLDDNTVITDQYHISAQTEQVITNMEAVISELLNRLDIEHTSSFMYQPDFYLKYADEEGAKE